MNFTEPSSQITIDLYGRFQSYFLLAVDFTAKCREVHGVSKQTYSEKGAFVTTAAVHGAKTIRLKAPIDINGYFEAKVPWTAFSRGRRKDDTFESVHRHPWLFERTAPYTAKRCEVHGEKTIRLKAALFSLRICCQVKFKLTL